MITRKMSGKKLNDGSRKRKRDREEKRDLFGKYEGHLEARGDLAYKKTGTCRSCPICVPKNLDGKLRHCDPKIRECNDKMT